MNPNTEKTSLTSSRLRQIARTTFIVGSVTFIVIGLAHTATQLTTLSGDAVVTAYRAGGPIAVNGEVVDGWDLFAGTSLLMGFYGVALGIANLGALAGSRRTDRLPPPGVSAANLAMLVGIAVVGVLYLGPLQSIGGAVGVALFSLPLAAALRHVDVDAVC